MDGILALGFLTISIILILISIVATLIIGAAIANYLQLSGIIWWSFIIVFCLVISGLVNNTGNC